ncbi:hypothetical protein GIB67_020804 [Kingdonia uniflora]|uniref:Inositol polyphosphate-related phosphatase domain-containing protein n=1 Tax=Kingdonia uniflora TaxID=39325 RepID=A0A7J7M755_9MAGN|nr:hypothetical protein GIB67_020804 [Kingdonia uniflora]
MEEEPPIEDVDGDILSTLTTAPPHRKIQSYSQQLGLPKATKKHNRLRKHSLDEDDLLPITTVTTARKTNSEHFYDSSDDDFFQSASSLNSSGNNSQRKEELEAQQQPLPEFIANGGGIGIFKAPIRGAMHPGRPPSLELRPHPHRETQMGSFLRNIVCTDTQLWAGEETGVRYWEFGNIYKGGCGVGRMRRRGDEDAAPFSESVHASSTLCLVVDLGSRLVWSGHKDGKIKSWKMEQSSNENPFKEGLEWNAHKSPVLSMAMTCYGDLWSGSEGGIIKVWPWESIEKSFSLPTEERHMASLLVERSYIDLRIQVTVNGVCPLPITDVKYLLSDNSRAKVWSSGYLSFALWDARTRELLKLFNVDGQIENRVDVSSVQDPCVEDEMKIKFVSSSKKEKPQGFFQRSRNALIGAADAVRRVATKGAYGDDNRRTEAIVQTIDGMIWTGCTNGLLIQWDGNGNRVHEFNRHPFAVQCFCTLGARIWVGYVSGTVQVLDLEGNFLGGWTAHSSPVINMTVGAGYVFTLANHGGIRGWNITSPGLLDHILRPELASKELLYKKLENLRVLTGTWNVGQGRASHDSLILWLGSAASEVEIVAVGLQEVEMGAGFLAMSAARETVGLEGSAIGQWWLDTIGKTLDEGTSFERVGSRQLAGLLIAVWVRKNLRQYVGDVDAAAVACGFGRAIGNKGAVGLRMRVYDRIICFVNCHLAAHLEAVNRRNADFDHIYKTMVFSKPSHLQNAASASVSSAVQTTRGTNAVGNHSEEGKPELSEADMVVFLGDFNYRLHGVSYDEARDLVSQRCFDWLRERDQLRAEMKAGKVFQGMHEGIITFPPTYKFEKHQAGLGGYDSSEKKRIPAWCDRILYRDSRSASVSECSLECPVVSSILQYEACMDVTDSDHKPVRCIYSVDIARIDKSIRREEFGEIIGSNEKIRPLLGVLRDVPETIVSTNNIILQSQDKSILQITNKSEIDKATYEIICEGQTTVKEDGQACEQRPRGSFGFPRWLEVSPATGVIRPGNVFEVSVTHEEFSTLEEFVDGVPQNWWCEDTRDKEVMLVLRVRGICSTAKKSHWVRVCHCFSAKNTRINSRSDHSRRTQGIDSVHRSSQNKDSVQRSEFRYLDSSSVVHDQLESDFSDSF